MAALRQVAIDLAAQFADAIPHDGTVEPPEVMLAANRANAHGPGLERPSPKDYNAIARRVIALLTSGRDLSRADLRDAAWCIWTTKPALADDSRALAAYLRMVIRMDQIRPYRSLASSYILNFHRDRPHLALVGRALAQNAAKAGLPWSIAHETYAIFDPDDVFKRLADVTLSPAIRPGRRLSDLRLGTLPSGAGLEVALHGYALEAIRTSPNSDPLRRLRAVSLWATGEDETLVDASLATQVADALLLPFRGETPDRDVRDRYVETIFRLLGDPRFEGQKWRGNATGEAIIRRWLGELSLRMFLDVVGRVQPPEFWQHRRDFWEAVYRASLVDEAWVVLEADGAIAARKSFGDHSSFARFAASSSGGAAAGAVGSELGRGVAALMLRIGTLTVVDWSHGGPCLIWDTERETGAPEIYRRVYEAARFRKITRGPETLESHAAQGIFWHSGSEDFIWQDQIAAYLQAARGIRLLPASYRV
jgi:hypothetical protein